MQLYEIGKLIGTGSSADVFLCRHVNEEEFAYAIKKIRMADGIEDKVRENIENELKLLQKLRHPNIVSFKDSFTDKEGNLCIVMVYCEAGDMHNRIKTTKEKGKCFTQEQIIDWLIQTSLAIYYLHNQKILHRDLKSQNLFLKKDERIRLGDFGIAKVLDATQDLTRTCIGTPCYMAPEVFNYQPYSYKSDIWSLGIILYELCNLRLPFEAQHYSGLACKVLKGSYPPITPTYSKPLRDLITSMLALKPVARPTIIDLLNKPFLKDKMDKYMTNLLSRNQTNEIYLDTLREQAVLLSVNLQEDDPIKKHPSSKDLEKKFGRAPLKKKEEGRREEEESDLLQYHTKRKSTFERDSQSNDKLSKRAEETSSSSFKGLNLYDGSKDEKEAFVDHFKANMMQRDRSKERKKYESGSRGSVNLSAQMTTPVPSKAPEYKDRKFRLYEQYTMDEESQISESVQCINEEIINEESDEDLQSTLNLGQLEEEEEVPESYNKSYYKLLDQVKVLKHRCETAMGSHKYLRAYNAVNVGERKEVILDILGAPMIGYWHLIDQILFNESILKTLPKH